LAAMLCPAAEDAALCEEYERREERTVDIFSVKTTARLRRGGETR